MLMMMERACGVIYIPLLARSDMHHDDRESIERNAQAFCLTLIDIYAGSSLVWTRGDSEAS